MVIDLIVSSARAMSLTGYFLVMKLAVLQLADTSCVPDHIVSNSCQVLSALASRLLNRDLTDEIVLSKHLVCHRAHSMYVLVTVLKEYTTRVC